MLARQDLFRAWKRGEIRFEPNISSDQISLSSIDLRLGLIFTKLKAHKHLVVRPAQDFDPSGFVTNTTLRPRQIFRLRPKEFQLGQTLERITLPASLAAHIHGRSSLARSGLAVHSTAPHIHPSSDFFSRPSPYSPAFHSPYTLPSSVFSKSFACHSYENCRGVGVFFPFRNAPLSTLTGHQEQSVTPLAATLTRKFVSVDSKEFTRKLSLLDATLINKEGEGGCSDDYFIARRG
jgi:hypothetical protein